MPANLEKYVPKDASIESKMERSNSDRKEIKDTLLAERLKGFKEAHRSKVHEAISKKAKEVKEDLAASEKKPHDDRLSSYGELLKDKKEGTDNELRTVAYAEIFDQEFNQNKFNGPKGWLSEYDKSAKDKPLEEFVLEKQNTELNVTREVLMEARIKDLVPDLFPELKGEGKDKVAQRDGKTNKLNADSKEYFTVNTARIEKLLSGEIVDSKAEQAAILAEYKLKVFGAELKPEQVKLVEGLFQNFLDDYSEMLNQKELVKKQNPVMVEMLMKGGVTPEEWQEKLNKNAEEEAKKIEAEQAKQKQAKEVVTPVTSFTGTDGVKVVEPSIDSSKELGAYSKITIEKVGDKPGEFEVKFPSAGGTEYTFLSVGTDKEGKRVYIFDKDKAVDETSIVSEKGFKEAVNSRYLAHVMVEEVKPAMQPNLKDILRTDEMMNLAKALYPKKNLSTDILSPTEIAVFRNLMAILTNSSNNISTKEEPYGKMQAIRNRIDMLAFLMTDVGRATTLNQELSKMTPEKVKLLSVVDLCVMMKLPPNNGDISKMK